MTVLTMSKGETVNTLVIRHEKKEEYRAVEEATREAFWNLYVPGCDEHYLVHLLRDSPDYIPELSFVAELEGRIVGSIFFAKSYVLDTKGKKHDTLSFGPVSVLPELHNQGIGTALIERAKKEAVSLGHRAIFIYGYPGYYQRFGFRHAKDFGISDPEGTFPFAHLALELYPGALDGIAGREFESDVYTVDEHAAQEYDKQFAPKEKAVTPSQKVFEETSARYL